MIMWHQCRELTDATARLNAPVPTGLTDIVELGDAFNDAIVAARTDPFAALKSALASGTATPADAPELVRGAAIALAVEEYCDRTRGTVESALHARFLAAVEGEPGEELIAGLRPQFDAAAAGLADCARLVRPGMTAEEIVGDVDIEPEVISAYRAIPKHAYVISAVHAVTSTIAGLGLLDESASFLDHGRLSLALVLDLHGHTLREASALAEGGGGRGGQWMTLTRNGYRLHLHTVAEARAQLDAELVALAGLPAGASVTAST